MGLDYPVVGIPCPQFQSTHPVWDGTLLMMDMSRSSIYFNPPIPCGMGLYAIAFATHDASISIHPSRVGWDYNTWLRRKVGGISIHPSRVGWDPPTTPPRAFPLKFQSTHPVWDGTLGKVFDRQRILISIHPSRVGWDDEMGTCARRPPYFNPPIPCGMGLGRDRTAAHAENFNPPIPCGMGLSVSASI